MKPRCKNEIARKSLLPPEFHAQVEGWFKQRFKTPTDVQIRAWPHISDGRNVIVTAPTGSGKTLAAFLWSINQLLTQQWPPGAVRVLYVSPLKALNNDIARNLTAPLRELRQRFEDRALDWIEGAFDAYSQQFSFFYQRCLVGAHIPLWMGNSHL